MNVIYNFRLGPLFVVLASYLDEVKIRLFEKIRTKLSGSTFIVINLPISLNYKVFLNLFGHFVHNLITYIHKY